MCSTFGDTGHRWRYITPTTEACRFYTHKYAEPVLSDSYQMRIGHFYVMDGKVAVCMQNMSVARYKLHEDVKVIRYCDMKGRGKDLLRDSLPKHQAIILPLK